LDPNLTNEMHQLIGQVDCKSKQGKSARINLMLYVTFTVEISA